MIYPPPDKHNPKKKHLSATGGDPVVDATATPAPKPKVVVGPIIVPYDTETTSLKPTFTPLSPVNTVELQMKDGTVLTVKPYPGKTSSSPSTAPIPVVLEPAPINDWLYSSAPTKAPTEPHKSIAEFLSLPKLLGDSCIAAAISTHNLPPESKKPTSFKQIYQQAIAKELSLAIGYGMGYPKLKELFEKQQKAVFEAAVKSTDTIHSLLYTEKKDTVHHSLADYHAIIEAFTKTTPPWPKNPDFGKSSFYAFPAPTDYYTNLYQTSVNALTRRHRPDPAYMNTLPMLGVLALNRNHMDEWVQIQHSLGNIVYWDPQTLRGVYRFSTDGPHYQIRVSTPKSSPFSANFRGYRPHKLYVLDGIPEDLVWECSLRLNDRHPDNIIREKPQATLEEFLV